MDPATHEVEGGDGKEAWAAGHEADEAEAWSTEKADPQRDASSNNG